MVFNKYLESNCTCIGKNLKTVLAYISHLIQNPLKMNHITKYQNKTTQMIGKNEKKNQDLGPHKDFI